MVTYKKSKNGRQITIYLKEDVGIEQAAKLNEQLLNAFKEEARLIINMDKITELHITGLQLITAAFLEAQKTNKSIGLKGYQKETVKRILEQHGMVYQNGAVMENEKNSFWVTGGVNG